MQKQSQKTAFWTIKIAVRAFVKGPTIATVPFSGSEPAKLTESGGKEACNLIQMIRFSIIYTTSLSMRESFRPPFIKLSPFLIDDLMVPIMGKRIHLGEKCHLKYTS